MALSQAVRRTLPEQDPAAARAGRRPHPIRRQSAAVGPRRAWSSQRHWHAHEDEFVFVLRGSVVLVSDAGDTVLNTGDCTGFKAGERDGHHLQNRGEATALILEVGTRGSGEPHAEYPDIDLRVNAHGYVHKDGTPYS
ncbi:MAG: cupin domain-containing protein [Acetobacteraceae bacterium]|nr:cupin domain-containing protein [Acetobacteraceae bacterium]